MTTVINTPSNKEGTDGNSGWAVAVIILLVVVGIGAYFWFQSRTPAETTNDTNINVTLPNTPATPTEDGTSNSQ